MGSTFLSGLGQGLMGGMSGGGQMGGMGGASGLSGGGGPMAPISGGGQPMGGGAPPPQAGGKGGPHPGMMGQQNAQTPLPPPRPPGMGNPMSSPQPPPRPPGIGNPATSPMPPPRPPGVGTPTPPMPPPRPPGVGSAAQPAATAAPAGSGASGPSLGGAPLPPPRPGGTNLRPQAKVGDNFLNQPGAKGQVAGPGAPSDSGAFKSKFPGHMGEVETTLRGGGLNPIATAGVMGNIQQESNFNPEASGDPSVPGGSHGLAQWNKDRLSAEKKFAGGGLGDATTQTKFLLQEANKRSPGLTDRMNAAKSPSEAAKIWMVAYEGPAAVTANLSGRQRYAENFAKGIVGKRGLASRGGEDTPSGGGGTFKMPDKKPGTDLVAAKGPDLTGGQQQADQQQNKKDKEGKGGVGKIDVPDAQNYVQVSEVAKPVENLLAQRYASFQEAAASKKATFKDLMDTA